MDSETIRTPSTQPSHPAGEFHPADLDPFWSQAEYGGRPGSYKQGNVVHLTGAVKITKSWTSDEAAKHGGFRIFRLPPGHRPTDWRKVLVYGQNAAGFVVKSLSITQEGNVALWLCSLEEGAFLHLDGISFVLNAY
jgi:hypothetical protein